MPNISIAIDGPAGAGKSTIAKIVAKRLSFIYIDTGAMYRAVTYYALKKDFNPLNEKLLSSKLDKIHITLNSEDRVFLNGTDVSKEIRSPEVTKLTSPVSAFPEVREHLVKIQREMASKDSVVMDGRDIGTNVLPRAEVKIFMVASPECRAMRRYKELKEKGENPSLGKILMDIQERDYRDSHRKLNPMVKAHDAVELDTSSLDIDEVVKAVLKIVKEKTGVEPKI